MPQVRLLLALAALAATAPVALAQPAPRDFKRWISDDVRWLLTPAERREASGLADRSSQLRFVREFWRRRDPTPDTLENELYDEHQQRLGEADAKFSSGKRGRFTDRGRIYISWGPPDFIETNPAGGRGFVLGPLSEAPELPTEVWTYEHLAGLPGRTGRVQAVFVDRGAGDYQFLTDPADANQAYAYRLNTAANPLQYESAAFLDPATGLRRTDRGAETARAEALGPDASLGSAANSFERIALGADLSRTAGQVLEDIERSQRLRRPWGEVQSRMFARRVPIAVDIPVFRAGAGEAYCPVALTIPGDMFAGEHGQRAELDVRGTVRDARSGARVRQFAETLRFDWDAPALARARRAGVTYQKAMTLAPGEYAVELSVAHPSASIFGSATARIAVPAAPETLTLAAVVLGDLGPARDAPGPFTVGEHDVRPRVTRQFESGERMHALAQIAGLTAGSNTELTVDYVVTRDDQVVFRSPLYLLPEEHGGLRERLLVVSLEPGPLEPASYVVQLKVIDHLTRRYAVSRLSFSVVPPPR